MEWLFLGAEAVYVWWATEVFIFSRRRRHTRWNCDWSSDVCSSDLKHKKPLRSWLKPKCGKAQRNNLADVYAVNYLSAVNRIASQSVRLSMIDFVGRIFLVVVHGILPQTIDGFGQTTRPRT